MNNNVKVRNIYSRIEDLITSKGYTRAKFRELNKELFEALGGDAEIARLKKEYDMIKYNKDRFEMYMIEKQMEISDKIRELKRTKENSEM